MKSCQTPRALCRQCGQNLKSANSALYRWQPATQTIQQDCTSCCQHSSRSSCRKAASGGSLVRAPGGSRRGQADAAACTGALSQALLPAGAGKTGRQAARFQAAGQCAQRGGSQPAEQVDCRTAADQTEHEDGRGDKAGCCCSHAATPGSSTSSSSRSRCSCKGSGKASLRALVSNSEKSPIELLSSSGKSLICLLQALRSRQSSWFQALRSR